MTVHAPSLPRWNVFTRVPPTDTVIDADDLKTHLRITGVSDDEYLALLINAATGWVEAYTGRRLFTQGVTEQLDFFPWGGVIPLHAYPVDPAAVVVKYDDTNDVEQTVDAADYLIHSNRFPPALQTATDASWPVARAKLGAVRVEMTVGEAAADVAEVFKQALRLICGHLYETREDTADVTITEVPMGAKWLLGNHRIWH